MSAHARRASPCRRCKTQPNCRSPQMARAFRPPTCGSRARGARHASAARRSRGRGAACGRCSPQRLAALCCRKTPCGRTREPPPTCPSPPCLQAAGVVALRHLVEARACRRTAEQSARRTRHSRIQRPRRRPRRRCGDEGARPAARCRERERARGVVHGLCRVALVQVFGDHIKDLLLGGPVLAGLESLAFQAGQHDLVAVDDIGLRGGSSAVTADLRSWRRWRRCASAHRALGPCNVRIH